MEAALFILVFKFMCISKSVLDGCAYSYQYGSSCKVDLRSCHASWQWNKGFRPYELCGTANHGYFSLMQTYGCCS